MRPLRIFPIIRAVCVTVVCGWVISSPAQEKIVLVGSGSNVPVRLYQAWLDEFNKKNPDVQVQYLPLGTSQSIHQISEGSGDFGGGEMPLTNEELHGHKVSLKQIPAVLVGIVPIYNLPGKMELNFSGDLLAEIYLGTVKNWKDPKIARLNPNEKLPDMPISVIHRSSGKGSNYIFSDFLAKTNAAFRNQVGKGPSPKWPVGSEANRGEDMVAKVAAVPGAIGYVELNFARNAGIGYGRVQNVAGRFVRATPDSIEAACRAVEKSIGDTFQVSMTNAPGKDSYPIASFTWIYVPISHTNATRSRALQQFLEWSLHDGQILASTMGYAALPGKVATAAQLAVKTLQ